MDDVVARNLRLWEGRPDPGRLTPRALDSTPDSPSASDVHQLYQAEALAQGRLREQAEPLSLHWFLEVEGARYRKYGRWIPSVLEFAKHANETILCLGEGLGTDWVQYARHGGSVVACSPSSEWLALARRNFELRGLGGRFLAAPATMIPMESCSIDVVCLSTLPTAAGETRATVEEVYRVLKPGGKVLALAPSRFNVDYWRRLLLPLLHWWAKRRKKVPELEASYSGRELRRLFERFEVRRIHKRHLRRSDVPHLWRLLPHSSLQRLIGRMLILKAFKPLSAAIENRLAA